MTRWLCFSVWFAGCAPGEGELLLAPDAASLGEDGSRGPLGAARWRRTAQARAVEAVPYAVIGPADATGAPIAGDYPLVAFVQGGFVATERYAWLHTHLASRGFVVIAAEHGADLALLEASNTDAVLVDLLDRRARSARDPLASLVDDDAPRVIAGHSLGGVTAALLWQRDPAWSSLALLASFPAGSGPIDARSASPVLSLVGDRDGYSEPAQVRDGWQRFASPAWYGEIEGFNHTGWSDDVTPGEAARDLPLACALADCRRAALRVFDAWLDGVTGAAPLDALEQAFPGAKVVANDAVTP